MIESTLRGFFTFPYNSEMTCDDLTDLNSEWVELLLLNTVETGYQIFF